MANKQKKLQIFGATESLWKQGENGVVADDKIFVDGEVFFCSE